MSQTTNSRTLAPQNTPFKSNHQTHSRVQISFPEQGRTKQSFKDECDVNRIMSHYLATGEIPNLNEVAPQYLDVSGMDFQTHQNFIVGAREVFMELPSSLRNRFSNDPAQFLDFCSNPSNRAEMAQMGLLRPITDPVIPNHQLSSLTSSTASNAVSSEPQKTA